jgi:hypothetical protein
VRTVRARVLFLAQEPQFDLIGWQPATACLERPHARASRSRHHGRTADTSRSRARALADSTTRASATPFASRWHRARYQTTPGPRSSCASRLARLYARFAARNSAFARWRCSLGTSASACSSSPIRGSCSAASSSSRARRSAWDRRPQPRTTGSHRRQSAHGLRSPAQHAAGEARVRLRATTCHCITRSSRGLFADLGTLSTGRDPPAPGLIWTFLVETMGLEPTTPCLQSRIMMTTHQGSVGRNPGQRPLPLTVITVECPRVPSVVGTWWARPVTSGPTAERDDEDDRPLRRSPLALGRGLGVARIGGHALQ